MSSGSRLIWPCSMVTSSVKCLPVIQDAILDAKVMPGSMFRGDDRTCGRHSPQLLMRCWKGAGHNPLCSGLAYFAILYFHLLLDGQSVPGRASKCQSAFSLLCTCKTKPGHFLKETENECIIFTFRKFPLLKVTWYSCRIKVDYLD